MFIAAPSYPSLGFGKLKFTRKALGAALRHTIKAPFAEESLFSWVSIEEGFGLVPIFETTS
jgi:hypothetical protein